MQFSLQDLRTLGYKKILGRYCPSENCLPSLVEKIYLCSLEVNHIKCSSYSLPRKWGLIKNTDYYGIRLFMKMCEPMIDDIEVDKNIQRRFRNKWDTMWGSISEAFSLPSEHESILKNYGIKMCFVDDSCILNSAIISFYNELILWYIFTQSESSYEMFGLTPLSLLELMIMKDERDFIDYIKSLFS